MLGSQGSKMSANLKCKLLVRFLLLEMSKLYLVFLIFPVFLEHPFEM